MNSLLKCPRISLDIINKYLSISNENRKFSNFGFCEKLLLKRFSEILDSPIDKLTLGSSATSLIRIACDLFSQKVKENNGIFYIPAFSFYSIFSIADSLDNHIEFYDIKDFSFIPLFKNNINENDIVYLNIPFGLSSKIDLFTNFAKKLPCKVIIDAAACLPGIIHKNLKIKELPSNTLMIFSLHATKLISCGEGGLAICGNDIPTYFSKLTNFGINPYRHQEWIKSTNAKMSEFNAAAGLCSLDMFDSNAKIIINSKEKASRICSKYKLDIFDPINEPTLTFNIKNEIERDVLQKLIDNKFEYRRWWALTKNIKKHNHKNSINAYRNIIGLTFDWENIDDYFEEMVKIIFKK